MLCSQPPNLHQPEAHGHMFMDPFLGPWVKSRPPSWPGVGVTQTREGLILQEPSCQGWGGLWCWEKLPAETPAAVAVEAEGVTQESGPLRGPCEQGHSTIMLWAQVIMRLRSTLAWAGAGPLGSLGLLKIEKHFFF